MFGKVPSVKDIIADVQARYDADDNITEAQVEALVIELKDRTEERTGSPIYWL